MQGTSNATAKCYTKPGIVSLPGYYDEESPSPSPSSSSASGSASSSPLLPEGEAEFSVSRLVEHQGKIGELRGNFKAR